MIRISFDGQTLLFCSFSLFQFRMAFEPFRMLRIFREKKITTQTNTHTHIRRRLSIIIYWYEGNGKFHSPRKLPVSFIIPRKLHQVSVFFIVRLRYCMELRELGCAVEYFFEFFFTALQHQQNRQNYRLSCGLSINLSLLSIDFSS